jgi:oligo-1,6-glucosidase
VATDSAPLANWWKRAVIYQIFPASFADSNGDGFGDLNGIVAKLDYLEALGVDALWLTPVYPTPWDDSGYDVADYEDIDPRFGTLADFDALLAAVHHRGMKLIMDLVANHTSDQHPWFVQSRSNRTNPRRDWYWWRPPRPGYVPGTPGAEPTNWRSEFHQPAWQYDVHTGEYYLHLYSAKQPDLNWENPQVRRAIHTMMRWWLDRGVDGFRMDVINKISKIASLPDAPSSAGQLYRSARQFYVNGPRLHEFLQEVHHEVISHYEDRLLMVGEASGATVEDGVKLTDPDRHELDMVFTFEHVRVDQGASTFDPVPLDLIALKTIMGRWQDGLADVGWNSLYWCNHDQPRIVSRWGDDDRYRVEAATMLATVLHLHRGTPFIYQGEEIGMTNTPIASLDDVVDIESRNYWAAATAAGIDARQILAGVQGMGRDNARTPMQWDTSGNGGFSDTNPWMPANPNYVAINAAAAFIDPASVWHHYRRLIELRHNDPVVTYGRFRMLLPQHQHIYAYVRELGTQALLVLGNFSSKSQPLELPDRWADAPLELGNYTLADAAAAARLRPWESRIHRIRDIANDDDAHTDAAHPAALPHKI